MSFDILENEEIITYREKEHDLLMRIRAGEYLNNEQQPTAEFFVLVNTLEKRLKYAPTPKKTIAPINKMITKILLLVFLFKFSLTILPPYHIHINYILTQIFHKKKT